MQTEIVFITRHVECYLKHVIAQGSKIALVRSYLRVPQAAGQVKILLFLVKIKKNPIYANIFCDAGQVPIFRYFEACSPLLYTLALSFCKRFLYE